MSTSPQSTLHNPATHSVSGNRWLALGALVAGLAVAAGAFGAHGLRGRVEAGLMTARQLEVFETAARYQMYTAGGLMVLGLLANSVPRSGPRLAVAGGCFVLALLLFSGSLYAFALSGRAVFGMIAPLGGLSMMGGWFVLAWAGLFSPGRG